MTRNEIVRAGITLIVTALCTAILMPISLALARLLEQPFFALLAVPMMTLAKILPSFLAGGKLQPRHPLVVGFMAGFIATVVINGRLNQPHLEPFSVCGEALATALICGVSMFSGRQFARLQATI